MKRQIAHVHAGGDIPGGPKRVLVIGASGGYGLASRITAAFGSGAATIGVFFERQGFNGIFADFFHIIPLQIDSILKIEPI